MNINAINSINVYHRLSVDKYLQDFPASFSLFVSSLKLTGKVKKKREKYIRTEDMANGEKGGTSLFQMIIDYLLLIILEIALLCDVLITEH
ncbi:MAG: hypothetical protein GY774_20035 [Planctomycetes bacterium]|nr:hypothetical protein [Planctomycetota bacterium]